jgi:hypothetical protein
MKPKNRWIKTDEMMELRLVTKTHPNAKVAT